MIETAKKLEEQTNMQRARIRILGEKIEQNYDGGKIAEKDNLIQDITYYKDKIEKQKKKTIQLKTMIESQNRLLAKEETRKYLEDKT